MESSSPTRETSATEASSLGGSDDLTVTHASEPATSPTDRIPPVGIPGTVMPTGRRYGHYEVCVLGNGVTPHELGRGAMGVSYKARDVNLDTFVAIKVIRAGLPGAVQARARFRREARAAAQLRHPNVASVFHFGETEGGECFYAMEYIQGETLAERVRRVGPLGVADTLAVGIQVTATLVAAEERGLVHRDLKPANLMLVAPTSGTRAATATASPSLVVKVIDFGLAKAVAAPPLGREPTEDEMPLTQFGGFFGTPAYASPEQIEGSAVDARSDIYSLGATLWFALTGQVPFPGRDLAEIRSRQLRHGGLPLAPLTAAGVPASLATLLVSMLSVHPAKRPANPTALLEALEDCDEEFARRTTGGSGGSRTASRSKRSQFPLPRRGSRPLVLLGAGLLLLVAGVGAFALWRSGRVRWPGLTGGNPPAPAVDQLEKSLAVLPLENLSEDKDNAFFADGIQDDVLTSLAKIKELKVISRSSVASYKAGAPRDLRAIGNTLEVANVLTGSVRRAGNRVLVNVELVNAANGRTLWAERYDRTLADALTLQGELATEIATALRATLSPEERARVEAKPTDNAEAYVLYLRARDYQTRPNVLMQDYRSAESLYGQAIALDPGFALARARLSATLAFIHENFLPTAEVHDRARAEAEESLRLRPDLGEGHLARALCLYWTEKNYAAALDELKVAARLLPNNSEIDRYTGAIRRRQGQWAGAVESMRRALQRDPRSTQAARELTRTECLIRDWPAAARDGQHAVAVAPDNLALQFDKCSIDFWARGDFAPLRAVLATVPNGIDPDGVVSLTRWEVAVVARDFAAADQVMTSSGQDTFVTQFGMIMPKAYFLACTALARGETARARPLMETACAALETQAQKYPQDASRQARLGVLYAYLGRKDEAIRQGRLAAELLPESKDTYLGPSITAQMALIYARTGETDQAITLIERLLRTPGGLVPGGEANMTQNDLRHRWQWDPIRADPRFQKLMTDPEPKTVYR